MTVPRRVRSKLDQVNHELAAAALVLSKRGPLESDSFEVHLYNAVVKLEATVYGLISYLDEGRQE